jgi:hypothetical protein
MPFSLAAFFKAAVLFALALSFSCFWITMVMIELVSLTQVNQSGDPPAIRISSTMPAVPAIDKSI